MLKGIKRAYIPPTLLYTIIYLTVDSIHKADGN